MSIETMSRPDSRYNTGQEKKFFRKESRVLDYQPLIERSSKSRSAYWAKKAEVKGPQNFHEQKTEWRNSVCNWIQNRAGNHARGRDGVIEALQAVGIQLDKKDIQKNLTQKIDAFYDTYLANNADIQKFVKDIASGVDLQTLEKRLYAVKGLLSSFGNTDGVPELVQEYAKKEIPQHRKKSEDKTIIPRRQAKRSSAIISAGAALVALGLIAPHVNFGQEAPEKAPGYTQEDESTRSKRFTALEYLAQEAKKDAREVRNTTPKLGEIDDAENLNGKGRTAITTKRPKKDIHATSFFGYSSEEQVAAGKKDMTDNFIFTYEDKVRKIVTEDNLSKMVKNKHNKWVVKKLHVKGKSGKELEKEIQWFSAGAGGQFKPGEMVLLTDEDGDQAVVMAADKGPAIWAQQKRQEPIFDMSWDAYHYLGEPGKVKAEKLPESVKRWVKLGPVKPQVDTFIKQEKQKNLNMSLLHEVQKELERTNGYQEKHNGYTKYGDWYHKNIANGSKDAEWYQKEHEGNYKTTKWCDMFLAYAAHNAGVEKFAGQFAYTPDHAQWFKKHHAWRQTPKPGTLVFFDWKNDGSINHVGIVEKVDKNGKIHTIEANSDDMLKRKIRNQTYVVGYGDPSMVKKNLG